MKKGFETETHTEIYPYYSNSADGQRKFPHHENLSVTHTFSGTDFPLEQ